MRTVWIAGAINIFGICAYVPSMSIVNISVAVIVNSITVNFIIIYKIIEVFVVRVEGGGHGDISYFDATRVASVSIASNFFLEAASQES